MTYTIELNNVTRSFGFGADRTVAVDQLSFAVPQGSVYGLLGANGAGKTTAIRMMVSHLLPDSGPDSGEVRVLGENPADQSENLRRRVAYISENMQLPQWMTLADAATFCRRQYPAWNDTLVGRLEQRFRLEGKKPYSDYSKGQRRAMCIILAFAQNAEVLILDEPASGLDTLARHDFLEEILAVACEENRTVLFSSHILGDIERIVDRVAILGRGRLIVEGELDSLKENVRRIRLPGRLPDAVTQDVFKTLQTRQSDKGTELVVTDFSEAKLEQLCRLLNLGDVTQADVEGLNLEELFVETVK
ncbi:MAG: ABC transporter ATP-binding protein [Planctomycetaceae bacterium]|nr:ABC transporter ATP-binding protein [Planctomycetaceae bacterium]